MNSKIAPVQLAKELLNFYKRPYMAIGNNEASLKSKIYHLLNAYLLALIATIIYGFLIAIIALFSKPFGLDFYAYIGHHTSLNEAMGVAYYSLFVVLLAPVYEEMMFRWCLRPSKISIAVAITLTLLCFVEFPWVADYSQIGTYINFSGCLLVGVMVYFTMSDKVIDLLKGRLFPYLLWFSVLAFGVIHIVNFKEIDALKVALIPLLLLPQFVGAINMSYMRLRFSLKWSIALHILINTTSVLLTLAM